MPRLDLPALAHQNTRLAIVLSHPTQYYSPWFQHLATHLHYPLRVFYLWDFGVSSQHDTRFNTTFRWDVDLLKGYEFEFVPNTAKRPGTRRFGGLRNPSLLRRLTAWRPDVVLLFGYAYLSNLRVMIAARSRGWRLLFRGDSHLIDHLAAHAIKRWLLKWLFRRISVALYVGRANRAYFETYGVPSNRLKFCPHAVDHTRFELARADSRRKAARRANSIPSEKHVFLFAGKFHPEKAPLELLESFLALNLENTMLILAGAGELEGKLQQRAAPHLDRVRFLPFANQSEMPDRYALADVFVLPSRGLYETWGLAVNEAMHAGVPCLVSHRVGCQQDLVTHRETGWVFRAGDSDSMSQVLREAYESLLRENQIELIRRNVIERIGQYTYSIATAALGDELHHQ